MLMNVLIVNI